MGSRLGTLKVAAARQGMTVAAYVARLDGGQKWCAKGHHWQRRELFGRDRTRHDGTDAHCSPCRRSSKRGGPTRVERIVARARGEAWCRSCRAWLPAAQVAQGACRPHLNEERRTYYATSETFRLRTRQVVHARKRGVAPIPAHAQRAILEEFEGLCAYCRSKPATTWDHIVAIAHGGRTTPGNVAPACARCNSSKRDRDIDVWMAKKGYTFCDALIERMILAHAGLYG